MTDLKKLYAANRMSQRETFRLLVVIPTSLALAVDEWGVTAGMTSRRESVETLLTDALNAKGVQLEQAS